MCCKPRPNTVSQLFDDELIIIELENGTYFSVNQAGAQVWNSLQSGHPPQALVESLDSAEHREQLSAFVSTLFEHKLVEWDRERTTSPELLPDWAPKPWIAPSISVYRDMQDLFQLDPIHEVDEVGWPSRGPIQ
jgi:hypothetical protein